ncbi:uncharacterized protein [Garra rufa]|uniref:uncharacterized protein n=1 Tax=Garra rufa TaxID=137080 RepID=UPI003CCEE046
MASKESRAVVRGSAHRRKKSKERPPLMSDLRIVLLGKSESENSLVGNFILGRAAFDSEAPPDVVERVTGRLKDRHIIIINSPQLLQTNISDHQITQTVRECVNLSDPGPHVIVLLLKHEQSSTEDQECVEKVLLSFSERVYQHTMVISTQEHTETNDILQKIIQKCANRYIRLQRNSSPDDLLQMFEDIVKVNDGCYLECAATSGCRVWDEFNQRLKQERVRMEKEKEDLQSKHEAEENKMKILMEQMNREREEMIKKHEEEKERIKMMMEEERQNQDKERKRREEELKREIREQEKQQREMRDEMIEEREDMRKEKESVKKEREKLKTEYDTEIDRLMNKIGNHETERKRREEEFNEIEERHKTLMKEKEEEKKEGMKREREEWEKQKLEEKMRREEEDEKGREKEQRDMDEFNQRLKQEREKMEKEKEDLQTKHEAEENKMKILMEKMNSKTEEIIKKHDEEKERMKMKMEEERQNQEKERKRREEEFREREEQYKRLIKDREIKESFSSRRIVLLGKSCVGKSSAGNTILGQKVFRSDMSFYSVTRGCSAAHATVSGRSVSVVDTPGLFDIQMTHERLMMEILRSVYLSSPGPHAFLIVFPINIRFTEHEQQIPQQIEMMFGQEVLKYSIILFTHGDLLKRHNIENLIEKNIKLRHLVDQCGGRYHVFNNEDENNREQVNDLLQKIDTMIEQNGGGHYSNEMFEDAQIFRREEEERKLKQSQGCVCS